MAADVRINMNTETYQSLRALLRYLMDSGPSSGPRQETAEADFTSTLRGQGRNVDKVPFGEWSGILAEECNNALRSV